MEERECGGQRIHQEPSAPGEARQQHIPPYMVTCKKEDDEEDERHRSDRLIKHNRTTALVGSRRGSSRHDANAGNQHEEGDRDIEHPHPSTHGARRQEARDHGERGRQRKETQVDSSQIP